MDKRAVNAKTDYFAVGDGIADDTTAIQNAVNSGYAVFVPAGTYKITQPINLSTADFLGAGSGITIFDLDETDGFITPLSGGRVTTQISNFRMISSNQNCQNKIAIQSEQSTGSSDRGSGFKFSYLEIGNGSGEHFGAAFQFSDIFRLSVQNVGISNCKNAILILGQVVQASFIDVTSNFDTSFTSSLLSNVSHGLYVGGSNHTGTFLLPESIKAINCSFVKHDIGINHIGALFAQYDKMDLDFCSKYGFYAGFTNGCTLKNSYIGLYNTVAANYGVYIDNADSSTLHQLTIEDNLIVAYENNHEDSIGITCPTYYRNGFHIIRNEIRSLVSGTTFKHGISLDRARFFEVTENTIYDNACSDYAINMIATEQFSIIRNVVINNDVYLEIGDTSYTSEDNICNNFYVTLAVGTARYLNKSRSSAEYKRLPIKHSGEWNEGYVQIGNAYLWWSGTDLRGKKGAAPTSATDGSIIL